MPRSVLGKKRIITIRDRIFSDEQMDQIQGIAVAACTLVYVHVDIL